MVLESKRSVIGAVVYKISLIHSKYVFVTKTIQPTKPNITRQSDDRFAIFEGVWS
jgi:hypothetical protein